MNIPLTKGQFAIIDDEDFDKVNQYKWQATWKSGTKSYYADTKIYNKNIKKQKTITMSRFILKLNWGDKRQVDHLNHNTLDNRKENLEIKTPRDNAANRRNKCKFGIGIVLDKKNKKNPFRYRVRIKQKMINIGACATAEEARIKREEWIKNNVK